MSLNLVKRILLYSSLIAATFLASCGVSEDKLQDYSQVKSALERRIETTQIDPETRNRYAILLNGDASRLHKNNISHAYEVLRELGFPEEDIFIVSRNYPRPDTSVQENDMVTAAGSKENFSAVIDYISKIADENDLLLIYGTGHGDRREGQSWICLSGGELSAQEYEGLIGTVKAGTIVSIMDQCYSGGFPIELGDCKANVIAISDTDSEHITYCKYFSEAFWDSFTDRTADTNEDGDVTIQEAYNFAIVKHREKLSGRKIGTDGQYTCSGDKTDVSLK